MENIQAGAVGAGGYVRAVFSRRVRGHVVALDLVVQVLRVKKRLAVRARLSVFRGWLS